MWLLMGNYCFSSPREGEAVGLPWLNVFSSLWKGRVYGCL